MVDVKTLAAKRKLARKAGFTLMEILIVLAIIATLMMLVVPNVMGQLEKSKVKTTGVQAKNLEQALEMMQLDIGRNPTDDEGLGLLFADSGDGVAGWSGPYLKGAMPQDGWGRDFIYVGDAGDGNPDIVSLGADGVEGGTGNDRDIHSNQAGADAANAQ